MMPCLNLSSLDGMSVNPDENIIINKGSRVRPLIRSFTTHLVYPASKHYLQKATDKNAFYVMML